VTGIRGALIVGATFGGLSASLRRRRRKAASAEHEVPSGAAVEDEVFDGPATIAIGDDRHQVRVRLTGHIDPIDGRYHWQGTVFEPLPADGLKGSAPVTLTVGDRTAPARITEKTPQGGYSVAGVGAPPFVLDDVEVTVPKI
jgi:hypothetical protein